MEQYKAAPLGFTAADVADLPSARPLLRDFPTPLVTLSESAVAHNLATMAAWCREAGVGIAPHGKTTMSRELWNRQLDAGAWGVTVATPWQASVALGWGVPRVLLANALVQPAALRALAADADRLTVWADSTRAVEIMTESLSGAEAPVPLDVLVELGGAGGRTGARGVEAALAVASAVAASPSLRLAGVAGYEGALAHDASPESLARVGDYLAELLELHDAIEAAGLYSPDDAVILTAGGSAYFDQVADALHVRLPGQDPEVADVDRADVDRLRGAGGVLERHADDVRPAGRHAEELAVDERGRGPLAPDAFADQENDHVLRVLELVAERHGDVGRAVGPALEDLVRRRRRDEPIGPHGGDEAVRREIPAPLRMRRGRGQGRQGDGAGRGEQGRSGA